MATFVKILSLMCRKKISDETIQIETQIVFIAERCVTRYVNWICVIVRDYL